MTKINILLITLMLFSVAGVAQQQLQAVKLQAAPMIPQSAPDYLPEVESGTAENPLGLRGLETQIGLTRFEVQSGGSLGRRVATFEDGKVSAVWLHGLDEAGGWPDRGSAYNHYDGDSWGDQPDESLEAIRSGYPSFTSTPSGTEVILSHKSETGSLWILQSHTKVPGESNWNETEIPSTVPGGPVWPKIATGGADGNTVHGMAVSVDPMFGGSVYLGMDQHPLYYRSLDAGQTWDQVDVVIPGLDSNFYNNIFGEGYNIDARGEVVATALFDSWGDIAVAKSTDNGESWEKTIVKDFPLDKYDGNGYTTDDIPFDPDAPDSLSMLTADYSGSVLVDNDGKVHLFFGLMYVYASGADQFLYLSTGGIGYWNEDFGTDSIQVIAELEDLDGDGMVNITGDLADLRYNNTGLLSFPSAGIDDEGNIYLVYTAMREDIAFEEDNYRHVFIIKSEDGGGSWSDPYDLINAETTDFPEFLEAAYPSIPASIGDALHLVYQQDLDPGLTTVGNAEDQLIMHLRLDKNTFGMLTDLEGIKEADNDFALSPNPARKQVQLTFTTKEPADVQTIVYNTIGERLTTSRTGVLDAGIQKLDLDLSDLSSGIYFVELRVDGLFIDSKKLIVK